MAWSIVYEKAIREDGSLLFPERLSKEFLDNARRVQGSYVFANQYQNEIIPEGEKIFKPHWIRYAQQLPKLLYHFAFIDPAISEASTADYTAYAVVSVDPLKHWYVRHTARVRINPSALMELIFKIHTEFKPQVIGFETVAFQRAIVHFALEEAKRRNISLPITGINRGPDKTKEMRILSLVPRFEWGGLSLCGPQPEMEMELAQFPRGAHDDILDALASIENIVYYPHEIRKQHEPPNPNDPGYESWFIEQLSKRHSQER